MNFKDVYKEAVDEIKGDREILNRPVKKKNTYEGKAKIIYAFGSAAAAAVLLFTVSSMPDFHSPIAETKNEKSIERVENNIHEKNEETSDTDMVLEKKTEPEKEQSAPKTVTEEQQKKTIPSASVQKQAPEVPVEKHDEPVVEKRHVRGSSNSKSELIKESADNNDSVSPMSEAAYVEEDNGVVAFSGSSDVIIESATEENNDFSDEVIIAKSSGGATTYARGGGGGAANTAENMPIEEFFAISNLEKEKIELDGYSVLMPEAAEVLHDEEGEVVSFVASFYLSKNESHLNVTISKGDAYRDSEIYSYEDETVASSDNGNISVYISALNVPEETVKTYLDKLMN